MKQTVCVTGASGGIGQALLAQLIDRYQVRALFRTRSDISERWADRGCSVVWGDLRDEDALLKLVAGTEVVFHCAAVMAGSYEESYAINVEGTRRLACAAARSGCRRLVYTSSVAVYGGATGDTDYSEETPVREHDGMAVYGRTKLQSEQVLLDVARTHGLEVTILRPTSVYGPNTRPYTLIPVELIQRGFPVILGDGRGILDAVYVDDVATALLLAAQSPQATGEVFNIGHEPVTLSDFYSHYGRMLNRRVRRLPLRVLSTAARLLQLAGGGRRTRLAELHRGAAFLIHMARNARRYPSTKAAALLGYAPRFTLSLGMLETELWLKQRGIIPRSRYVLEDYGPLPFRPVAVVHPASEADIADVNRIAVAAGTKVKAVGSLHSLCPIPETDGICIVLDRCNRLLKVDGCLVTVEAGMKLRDLNDALAGLQLALPVNGSITEQTVAGAISTATHGGSIHFGTLSDYVEAVRIVRADGSIVEVDRSQNVSGAAFVSLGLLGVISAVTFRCVPPFVLRSRSIVKQAVDVLEQFDAVNRSSLYVDMLYFPAHDTMEILCVDHVDDGALEEYGHGRRMTPSRPVTTNGRVAQRLRVLGVKAFAWLLYHSRLHRLQKHITGLAVGSSYQGRVGRSDLVLAFGDREAAARSPMTIQDMEIAIPYERAAAALGVLRDHFLATRQCPLLPIHIRCSARSRLWLSPTYERDVCWVEIWQYPRSDRLFRQVHELMKPFGYRFHWGKEAHADRAYIRRQYDRWDDFVRLREEWDPRRLFMNPYLESFFG